MNVERRGQTKVERLTHNVGGQEIQQCAGELTVQPGAKTAHVFTRGRVAALERNENIRVAGAKKAAAAITEADAGVGYADVVEYSAEFLRGQLLTDGGLNLVHEPRGFLDAPSGGSAHVQTELAGVNGREKVLAQLAHQKPGTGAEREEAGRAGQAMLQTDCEHRAVGVAETGEPALEPALDANERASPSRSGRLVHRLTAVLDLAVEPQDQRGHESSRNHVAGQHGEHDRLRQRDEQEPGDAGEEKHRHKHDTDAERGDERGQRDFLGTVEDGLFELFPPGHVAVDVLEGNRGIVHQNANRERQAAEGHEVDGFAQSAEDGNGTQHGERDRQRNDERAAPRTKEQKNHQCRECRGDGALFADVVDGGSDEK